MPKLIDGSFFNGTTEPAPPVQSAQSQRLRSILGDTKLQTNLLAKALQDIHPGIEIQAVFAETRRAESNTPSPPRPEQ